MNNLHLSSLILFAVALASCASSVVSVLIARRMYLRAEDAHAVLLQMEGEMAALSSDLDRHTERATTQANRIAWLESRLRGTKPAVSAAPDLPLDFTAKMTMTERRHRVLKLHQRGQDTQTIAVTLGMARGEVELILGLTAVAA